MEQWYCFECKEKMVEGNVLINYLDTTYTIEGIKCPKCSTAYLLEEIVQDKVVRVEAMMETN